MWKYLKYDISLVKRKYFIVLGITLCFLLVAFMMYGQMPVEVNTSEFIIILAGVILIVGNNMVLSSHIRNLYSGNHLFLKSVPISYHTLMMISYFHVVLMNIVTLIVVLIMFAFVYLFSNGQDMYLNILAIITIASMFFIDTLLPLIFCNVQFSKKLEKYRKRIDSVIDGVFFAFVILAMNIIRPVQKGVLSITFIILACMSSIAVWYIAKSKV